MKTETSPFPLLLEDMRRITLPNNWPNHWRELERIGHDVVEVLLQELPGGTKETHVSSEGWN
jgi:hypothetical protein